MWTILRIFPCKGLITPQDAMMMCVSYAWGCFLNSISLIKILKYSCNDSFYDCSHIAGQISFQPSLQLYSIYWLHLYDCRLLIKRLHVQDLTKVSPLRFKKPITHTIFNRVIEGISKVRLLCKVHQLENNNVFFKKRVTGLF